MLLTHKDKAMTNSGMPSNYRGVVRLHGAWGERVMTHWEQTTRKMLRDVVQYEEWNPNTCIYSAVVYPPLHCTNRLVWCTQTDSLLQIRKQESQGLKMLIHHLKWPIFQVVYFLILILKRADGKKQLQRIWRKCTVLNSWLFIQPCTWAVWYLTIIYSVERVQMHSQNKLQQKKLHYQVTKTHSGFIPQSTSVNQLVSSSDSQTCWLNIMNSLITVWRGTLSH